MTAGSTVADVRRAAPRHAKTQGDLAAECDRLRGIMTEAFTEFAADVRGGAFPEPRHLLEVDGAEVVRFGAGREGLGSAQPTANPSFRAASRSRSSAV